MIHNKRALKTLYFKLSLKKYLKRVSEIIASSSNELLYLNEFGLKNSSSFIYNGYTSFSENEHPKDVFIHNKPFLLFLGYLDPRKQPDLLIRAFHSSKAKNIYKLVLAGPDLYGYQMELETLAKSLNLIVGENIDFTGRVTGKIKWELLRNARALILPSKGEGWPVVIAEAIGNETPCILSKECNFSEITQLNLGVEVTDHSISAWSAAIDEICFDEITYEKYKSSLEKNRLNFTWYAITNQWIAKYYSIINDAKTK
jgi:glycosyltransferase involved in cell wall biosynthesis